MTGLIRVIVATDIVGTIVTFDIPRIPFDLPQNVRYTYGGSKLLFTD